MYKLTANYTMIKLSILTQHNLEVWFSLTRRFVQSVATNLPLKQFHDHKTTITTCSQDLVTYPALITPMQSTILVVCQSPLYELGGLTNSRNLTSLMQPQECLTIYSRAGSCSNKHTHTIIVTTYVKLSTTRQYYHIVYMYIDKSGLPDQLPAQYDSC